MTDSTTPRTRMTHGYLRWIATHVLADSASLSASSAVGAQLGPVRPRAHAAAESIISSHRRHGRGRLPQLPP